MNIFINQAHLQLLSLDEVPTEDYDAQIDLQTIASTTPVPTRAWIKNADIKYLHQTILWLMNQQMGHLRFIAFSFSNLEEIKNSIKQSFQVIQAGGGVVRKQNKMLLISRLGKWDLPKGKMDEGESFPETAKREVEEECGIKVELLDKIATTWHYYAMKGNHFLKQTRWYMMDCLDDAYLKPQIEEDISEVRWCEVQEAMHLLENSYGSIRFVVRSYIKKVTA
ncbi:MAG: NUDIX hydrolase [Bacteroidetes bacterium]|nr:MAG: NUDIX hydrolase [Bacteroidota bacterium]